MKISVCTTTARAGFIEHQARMIARQKMAEHTIEWVLVDFDYENSHQSLRVLADHLGLALTHTTNVRDDIKYYRDIARNRNKALALAKGDYVIFLDDYAVIPDTWALQHLKILVNGYLSAGNMYRLETQIDDLSFVDTISPGTILEQYKAGIGLDYRYFSNGVYRHLPYLSAGISYTGNLGIPMAIVNRLNGFDPRMAAGLEDCDFGLRANMVGIGCYFNPVAYAINLQVGHIPYVFTFDHPHDVEPFISNHNNNFFGDANMKENANFYLEFYPNYRIAHCKHCGAQGMVDPNELIAHKHRVKESVVPAGLPGGLDTLRMLLHRDDAGVH